MRLLRNLLHRAAKPPKGGDDALSAKPRKGRARAAARPVAVSENLAQYRDDPVGFILDVLPDAGLPYAKQREMLELLVHNRRVSVVGCYASGKDWAAARAVLWWLETRPHAKVVVTGPTQRQVREIVWREMRIARKAASAPLAGKILRDRYEIDDDRFAIGFSTNKPDNLQGFHSPNLMVIVTEAHAMKPAFEEALKRLNPARVLLTGNALSSNGEFYESHRAKRGNYQRVRISAYDTPAFTGENIDVPGLMTETDIAEREDDYGRDHPLFMAGVLALFPDAQDDSLVGRQAVEDAMDPAAPSGDGAPTEEEDAREPVYVGVDVARFGFDKSALVARRGQRVVAAKTFAKMDTMRLAFEAAEMAREWRADAVFVDETGVGGGVVDRLRELGAPVYGVQFGGKPLRRARFANLRSEIFWELRRLMNDRLIAFPPDDALAGQLLSFRYDVSSSGQVRLESKKDMRGRGLPSPDKADALAMAFMRPPSLQIWTGNEPFLRPPAGVPLPPPTRPDDDAAPEPSGADDAAAYGGENYLLPPGEGQGEGAAAPDPPGDGDGADPPPPHGGDKYPLPLGDGQGEGRPPSPILVGW